MEYGEWRTGYVLVLPASVILYSETGEVPKMEK